MDFDRMDQKKKSRLYMRAFLGGLGILCGWWAIGCLRDGKYLNAIMMLVFAACCFAVFGIWFTLGSVVAQGSFDPSGTTIRPDRRIELLMHVVSLTALFGIALFGILQLTNKLDIPLRQYMYAPFAVMFAAGAVILLPWYCCMIFRGLGYVRLTLDGFEFEGGIQLQQGSWLAVTEVTDEVPDKREIWSTLVMVMEDGEFLTAVAASMYTPEGRALREFVRFYWQHPEVRKELTDGRALERLRNEQFMAS